MTTETDRNAFGALVHEDRADEFERRAARLATRCGVTFRRVEGRSHRYPLHRGRVLTDYALPCARFEIGNLPRINGWHYAGTVEHTEAGNMVTVPSWADPLPATFRDAEPVCEHCRTSRRRKKTYVLRGPEGQLVQIGHSCLAEFLAASPEALVALSELAESLGEGDGDFAGDFDSYGGSWSTLTERFVACAVACVDSDGFRRSDMDGSTKDTARFAAGPCPQNSKYAERWHALQPTAAQVARARDALTWVLSTAEPSDYMHNLRVAAGCAWADGHEGLLASLPSTYARHLAEEAAIANDGGHVGTVGKREDFDATLTRLHTYDTDFGSKTIVTFTTAAGSLLVWRATGRHPSTSDIGKRFTVKGTVKAHDHYRGRAQTVLTRCAYQCVEDAELDAELDRLERSGLEGKALAKAINAIEQLRECAA